MINKESYKNLFASVKRMALLRFEGLRLGAVDKATVLLSTIALVIVAFILVSAALLFFAIALTYWLSTVISTPWAFLIVGAIFLVLLGGIFLARRKLVFDPVARGLSRLFLSPEKTDDDETK